MEKALKIELITQNLPKRIELNKSKRYSIFLIFFWLTIISHLTINIFKSNQEYIIKNYNLNVTTFGLLGSIYFLGKFFGTLILLLVINSQNKKRLIIFSIFSASMFLSLFYFTNNKYLIMFSFFMTGFCLIYSSIYIPIWIDQFATNKRKTIYLSLINFGKILGLELGYVINYILKNKYFKEQYLTESVLLFFIFLLLSCKSNIYFNSKVLIIKEDYNKEDELKEINNKFEENSIELNIDESIKSNNSSLFMIRTSNESTIKLSLFGKIKNIMNNKIYICCLFSATILYFCQSAFLFWSIDFVNDNYNYEDFQIQNFINQTNYSNFNEVNNKTLNIKPLFISNIINNNATVNNNKLRNLEIININFFKENFNLIIIIFITLFGQIGSLFNNCIFSFLFGNYAKKFSSFILLLFYIITTLSGNFLIYYMNLENKNKYKSFLIIISYLIFSASSLPLLQGISINNISASLKELSFTIFNLFLQIFGEVPSVYLYGLIKNKYKNKKNFALNITMKYNILGCFFTILIFIFVCMKKDEKEEEKIFKNKEEKKEIGEIEDSEQLDLSRRGSKEFKENE